MKFSLSGGATGVVAHILIAKVTRPDGTIPVDRYPAWRSWIQRIDALMHKNVRLYQRGGK